MSSIGYLRPLNLLEKLNCFIGVSNLILGAYQLLIGNFWVSLWVSFLGCMILYMNHPDHSTLG